MSCFFNYAERVDYLAKHGFPEQNDMCTHFVDQATGSSKPPPNPANYEGYWTEICRLLYARRLRQVLPKRSSEIKQVPELAAHPPLPQAADVARLAEIETEVRMLARRARMKATPDVLASACNLLLWETFIDEEERPKPFTTGLSRKKRCPSVARLCSLEMDRGSMLLERCGLSRAEQLFARSFRMDLCFSPNVGQGDSNEDLDA